MARMQHWGQVGVHIAAAPLYLRVRMKSESSRAVTCPAAWLDLTVATICLSPRCRQWSRSGHTVRVPGRAGVPCATQKCAQLMDEWIGLHGGFHVSREQ